MLTPSAAECGPDAFLNVVGRIAVDMLRSETHSYLEIDFPEMGGATRIRATFLHDDFRRDLTKAADEQISCDDHGQVT